MKQHEQVPVTLPSGEATTVDKEIALLIRALWARDIVTRYSCQGYASRLAAHPIRRRAYVQCVGTDEAEAALIQILPVFQGSVIEAGSYTEERGVKPTSAHQYDLLVHRDSGYGSLQLHRLTFYFAPRFIEPVRLALLQVDRRGRAR